jgi:uncharacterized protein (TIGR02594 family)
MRKWEGLHELSNGHLNPLVREFFTKHTHFPPENITDTTPWCSAAACAALEKSGLKSPHSAAAASFETFGSPCNPAKVGAILVFRRTDQSGRSARHVAFSEGLSGPGKVFARGGNQLNRVCVEEKALADLVASRWPV